MAYKRRRMNRRFKRSRRGKFSRRRPRVTFQRRVKRVMLRQSETKWMTLALENQQLYHNTGLPLGAHVKPIVFDPWNPTYVPRGTGIHERIGDSVVPRGMKIKIWLANKYDRPNILYRVLVLVLPRMYNNSIVSSGSIDIGETPTGGSNGNYAMLPVDTSKGIKVLYDRLIRNEIGFSSFNGNGRECHKMVNLFIKSKGRPIKYDPAAGTPGHVNNFLAIYVIPYDSYGTLTTDNIASCAFHYKLYWKDP